MGITQAVRLHASFEPSPTTWTEFAKAVRTAETVNQLHSAYADNGETEAACAIEDDALEARATVRSMLASLTGISADRIAGVI